MEGSLLIRILLIATFLLTCLHSQDDKWIFKADGEFEQVMVGDEPVRRFSENVYIHRDTLSLFTDVALQYTKQRELHLLGNTRMISGMDTLTCDSMIFWMEKDSTYASGQVKLHQSERTLISNSITYWKTMGFRQSSFKAVGNVEIVGEDNFILANEVGYNDSNQQMTLLKNASVADRSRTIKGEDIFIQYNDSLLNTIAVTGNATSTNTVHAHVDPVARLQKFQDEMQSKRMDVSFINGKLSQLKMSSMATSLFHVIEDTLYMGRNEATGDTIIISFVDEVLNRIQITGGARGKFIPDPGNASVDSTVIYEAEFVDYHILNEESFLHKNASVNYQGTLLKAGDIHVDWQKSLLDAFADENQKPTVTTSTDEPMVGDVLTFNLNTRHGIINHGRTEFNDAYYQGEKIYRDEPNLFHVDKSIYTSCDLDIPHYYFSSKKMKIIPGDRVIARPLWLYIYDIPIIGVPLAVFPSKGGGRRSGWIMPSFGTTASRGTFFRHLGYFWAPNDYLDMKTLFSFYDEHGVDARTTLYYKKRYRYNGKIHSTFYRKLIDSNEIVSLLSDTYSQNWDLKWTHSHKIDPTQNLSVNYTYVSSSNFYQDTGYDLNTRLNQKINSSFNYSKNWSAWKNSMSVNVSEIYDLLAKSDPPENISDIVFYKSRSLPRISFRHGQSPLLGVGDRWYNGLYWSLASNMNGSQKIGQIADTDTSWAAGDTSVYTKGVNHSISFSAPQKLFNWLTLNPKISLKENWLFEYRQPEYSSTGTIFIGSSNYRMKSGFKRRMTGSFSLSANTKIYGIFPFSIGKMEAVRHVITPSISYTYRPDFTQEFWGFNPNYVLRDSEGSLFDPFLGSSAGSTPSKELQSIGIRIQNLFQMKYRKGGNQFEKVDLFSWKMNTSYNMAADSLNWSTIRSSFQTTIPGGTRVDISTVHDLYDENNSGNRINIYKNEWYGVPVPYLTRMEASTSFKLSGKRLTGFEFEEIDADTTGFSDENLLDITEENLVPQMGKDNLWQAVFSLRYNKNQKREYNFQIDAYENVWDDNFWLNTNLKIKLSQHWKLTYNVRFDLVKQQMLSQSFHIYRPLHCWEFSFKWWPSGGSQGFFLNIHVKNPDLQDIKLESRGGKRRLFGI